MSLNAVSDGKVDIAMEHLDADVSLLETEIATLKTKVVGLEGMVGTTAGAAPAAGGEEAAAEAASALQRQAPTDLKSRISALEASADDLLSRTGMLESEVVGSSAATSLLSVDQDPVIGFTSRVSVLQ